MIEKSVPQDHGLSSLGDGFFYPTLILMIHYFIDDQAIDSGDVDHDENNEDDEEETEDTTEVKVSHLICQGC